jgi:predicted Holliday junction resolvase-like endonuclease
LCCVYNLCRIVFLLGYEIILLCCVLSIIKITIIFYLFRVRELIKKLEEDRKKDEKLKKKEQGKKNAKAVLEKKTENATPENEIPDEKVNEEGSESKATKDKKSK